MFEFSKIVREIFLECKETIDLPFFYSFPKNSCESASYFLGALLAQSFPNTKFYVVHGYHRNTDENHFWIEADDKIIDITADQFSGIRSPIYGAEKHPLAGKFKIESKVDALQGLREFDLIELDRKKVVFEQLIESIKQRT